MRNTIIGAILAALTLVIPRLPLFKSGLGTGRLSIVGTHKLCASTLGRPASALSGSASKGCATAPTVSAIGWATPLTGLLLLTLAGYRAARPTTPPA